MKLTLEDVQNLYSILTSDRLTISAKEAQTIVELQFKLKQAIEDTLRPPPKDVEPST